MSIRRTGIERTALSAVCGLLLLSCATNPVTGRKQFTLFTEAEEIQLGLEADRQMLPAFGEYREDPELSAYVEQLGQRIAARSERPSLPWSFRVIDDEIVNAFALPGGKIYVTRGLLAHLGRESELAGVLGHEIGHVTARHAIYGMSRDLALAAVLAVGLAVADVEEAEPYAALGLGLLFLKFSRNQERQADELATRYAPLAGLDPYGAVDALRILWRVSATKGDGWFPTWLSTHPDPERRWRRLALETGLSAPGEGAELQADRERYLTRLDGLVFGADPRAGELREALYLHVRDGFQIDFPRGWAIVREGQSVVATHPEGNAHVLLLRGPEATPEEALRTLEAEEGVQTGAPWSESLGAFAALWAEFDAEMEGEPIKGRAAFAQVEGSVVKLLAFARADDWSARQAEMLGSLRSFGPFDRTAAPTAGPARLRIVRVGRPTTLRRLAAERSPGIEPETVALLNDLDLDQPLEAGRVVKLVELPPS